VCSSDLLAMTGDQTEECLEFGRRALDLAARFADFGVRSHALNNIGTALMKYDNPIGLANLEESLAVALDHNLQEHAGRAYANLVSTAVVQRRSDLMERYLL